MTTTQTPTPRRRFRVSLMSLLVGAALTGALFTLGSDAIQPAGAQPNAADERDAFNLAVRLELPARVTLGYPLNRFDVPVTVEYDRVGRPERDQAAAVRLRVTVAVFANGGLVERFRVHDRSGRRTVRVPGQLFDPTSLNRVTARIYADNISFVERTREDNTETRIVRVMPPVPGEVRGLHAIVRTDDVRVRVVTPVRKIEWNALPFADMYEIDVRPDRDNGPSWDRLGVTTLPYAFDDTGLLTAAYRVRAVNSSGVGRWTEISHRIEELIERGG